MGWIQTRAQWLNLWSALLQRTWAFLDAIGVKTWITGVVWFGLSGVSAMIVWLHDHLPWWAIAAIALLLASLTTRLFAELRRAWAVVGIKKLSLDTAAMACERFEERYWNFIEANQHEIQMATINPYTTAPDMRVELEKAREVEEVVMRKMRGRLGSEVGALIAILSSLNIMAESDFRSLHWSNGLARYYGAVGRLLRQGLLEEAQNLDRKRLFF